MTTPTFRDLALATYCARKLYYRRRESDRSPPPDVEPVRELAFQYSTILGSGGSTLLGDAPIAVSPTRYRSNLTRARDRLDVWDQLVDPPARDVYLEGRTSRGVAHKVLADPLAPSVVSAGRPPSSGVWRTQSVRLVAAAKALAWEHETPVERGFVEYPAYGLIRAIELSTRRKADYRSALRTVRSLDGPPPRIRHAAKCTACEYVTECWV